MSLSINTKKSVVLSTISPNEGKVLSSVSSLRLLGVTFSSDLSWNLHVNDIVKKRYRRLYVLRNLKRAYCPPFLKYKCYVFLLYQYYCTFLVVFAIFLTICFIVLYKLKNVQVNFFYLTSFTL